MTDPIIVGLLVATATYLILQRGLVRIVLGIVVLGHASHILLLLAGGLDRRGIPFAGVAAAADPLPQAFALTAIVISFGVTAFLLAIAYRWSDIIGSDASDEEESG
jgi:multicomponent Na+:H+ antiporter subunit C